MVHRDWLSCTASAKTVPLSKDPVIRAIRKLLLVKVQS